MKRITFRWIFAQTKSRALKLSIAGLFLLAIAQTQVYAWDDGYVKLEVPSISSAPLSVELDFSHSFLQLIPPSGANVRLGANFVVLDTARLGLTYLSKQQEIDLELAGWLPLGPFRVGGAWNLVWSSEPLNGLRYWAQTMTILASGYLVPDLLHGAVNIQYDTYVQAFNGGLGLTLDIVPSVFSVVAEGMFKVQPAFHWGWDAGLLIKTGGHQFYIFVGSGNDLRMHTSMFAAALPDSLSAGFVIRRQLDIYPDTSTPQQPPPDTSQTQEPGGGDTTDSQGNSDAQ